jgi:DNA-binding transcriptional LysR family regulator
MPDVPLELIAVSAAEAEAALREGTADAALVRLPVDRTGLSAIPLYSEATVVVVPKDHEVTAVDEVAVADLADYVVQHPVDDRLDWESGLPGTAAQQRPDTTQDAVELVAAGVGLLLVPQSLARLHHRKDLTFRPVPDAPQSRIALAWLEEKTTDLMEEFIGIVRGRTVNSSRGRAAAPPDPKAAGKGAKAEKADKATKSAGSGRASSSSARSGGGRPSQGTARRGGGKPRRRS